MKPLPTVLFHNRIPGAYLWRHAYCMPAVNYDITDLPKLNKHLQFVSFTFTIMWFPALDEGQPMIWKTSQEKVFDICCWFYRIKMKIRTRVFWILQSRLALIYSLIVLLLLQIYLGKKHTHTHKNFPKLWDNLNVILFHSLTI